MIKIGSPDVYHSVCIDSRHNYLRWYKMGDNSCSISALNVNTTATTITTSFRGVATFCKYKCPQRKVFRLHISLARFL